MRECLFFWVVFSVSACTTIESATRIPIVVTAQEFNSIASQYYERPTFGSIVKNNRGELSLAIVMDTYGSGMATVFFDRRHLDSYRHALDVFLQMDALARNSDVLRTEIISKEKGGGTLPDQEYEFGFHSASQGRNYLFITHCTAVMCLESASQYYDPKNVKLLRILLDEFEERVSM